MKALITREEKRRFLALLKEIRLNSGLQQGKLAEMLGCPQSVVSKFESGERRIDFLELRRVCQAVGLSIVDFAEIYEQSLK